MSMFSASEAADAGLIIFKTKNPAIYQKFIYLI